MADPGAVARAERGGRPRDPGNDNAILDAALDLFVERGAAGASIEAIARRAGVAKLTVYRRWQAKEDLLMAALEHARDPDAARHAGVPPTVEGLVTSTAELLSSPRFRALMARVIGASVDHPALVDAYTTRYLRPRQEAVAAVLRQAVADGRFPPDTDPDAVQDVLAGSVGMVLLAGTELTAAEVERRLRALLRLAGYRGPTTAPEDVAGPSD